MKRVLRLHGANVEKHYNLFCIVQGTSRMSMPYRCNAAGTEHVLESQIFIVLAQMGGLDMIAPRRLVLGAMHGLVSSRGLKIPSTAHYRPAAQQGHVMKSVGNAFVCLDSLAKHAIACNVLGTPKGVSLAVDMASAFQCDQLHFKLSLNLAPQLSTRMAKFLTTPTLGTQITCTRAYAMRASMGMTAASAHAHVVMI
jgi:hypothetical protein